MPPPTMFQQRSSFHRNSRLGDESHPNQRLSGFHNRDHEQFPERPQRGSVRMQNQKSLKKDNDFGYEEQEDEGFFQKVSNAFRNFNLCLRPQKQSKQLIDFLSQFQVISLYQDPYFGECYALRSKEIINSHKQLNLQHSLFNNLKSNKKSYNAHLRDENQNQNSDMLKQYVALSKEKWSKSQFKDRKDELEEIGKYSGSEQNVLSFRIICEIEKQQFLFSKIEMYIAYDFVLIDLEKEFENRVMYKRNFTESQINIIMKQCCTGLVALENTNYRSFRMAYIYLCQNGNQIKVAHPQMFKYETNLETIDRKPKEKGVYLSPQELSMLEKNEISFAQQPKEEDGNFGISNSYNNKAESSNSFTFGMVILSLMCNRYLNEIYDYRTCEINYHKVKELLHNLTNGYSERLIKIIQNLLRPKLEERLTLRSLLNLLEQKYELSDKVQVTLLKEHLLDQNQDPNFGYRPLFEEEDQNPQYKNYLYGMVYPKIGVEGEYYHYDQKNPFSNNRDFDNLNNIQNQDGIIANHRYSYNDLGSKYIGDSLERNGIGEKPMKEGKGIYMLENGQSYIGEWKNNEMHGYGKLFWPQKKIRYEGEFENGQFSGFGTEFAYEQDPDRQDEIDKTFVRLHKGSWLKYEGRFKNDRRHGPGKAFFKNGKWVGNFKNGQSSGNGIWQGSDGDRYKGVWKDGYLDQDR